MLFSLEGYKICDRRQLNSSVPKLDIQSSWSMVWQAEILGAPHPKAYTYVDPRSQALHAQYEFSQDEAKVALSSQHVQ